MRTLIKNTLWCDGCERNEQVEHDSALRKWRLMWISPRDHRLHTMPSAHPDDLTMTYVPKDVKHCCGDQCASKLFSRWLNTGSLSAPRGNVAEPVLFASTEGA